VTIWSDLYRARDAYPEVVDYTPADYDQLERSAGFYSMPLQVRLRMAEQYSHQSIILADA
jgi:hypothetical protein